MADSLNTPTLPETETLDHPTDELAINLSTTYAILDAIIACFRGGDKHGAYVIPEISVHYALCHVHSLISKCEKSLDRLNDDFDVPVQPRGRAAMAVQS